MKFFIKLVMVGMFVVLGGAYLYGRRLPREHVVTSSIVLVTQADTVFRLMRNIEASPSWWSDVKAVERIAGARDLVALLQERPLAAKEWRQVGAAIARLHEAGGYHSDLNSHNLLLDERGKVWIIDLDKGGLRRPGAWQQANLARLLRSLRKEAVRLTPFHWQETDWADLLAGYTVASA